MTKPPGTPRKQPEPRRRVVKPRYAESRQSRDHGHLPSLSLSPTALRNDIGNVTSTWPTPPESAARTTQSGSDSLRSFYLGSTSYASVFAEERPIPDSLHEQPPESLGATPIVPSRLAGTRHCRMALGTSVVAKLSPFSLMERCIHAYFAINKGSALVGPLVKSALPQLRKDVEGLVSMADPYPAYAEITRNSTRPLNVPSTLLPSEFHTLFTGPNLRWETMGLILIISGSAAEYSAPDDPLFTLDDGTKIDKEEFIEDMIHTSNDVISLCQVHGAVNDIVVWLIYINMLVTSNFYGDNYHGVWRRMGDCISALYAEGIHCEETFDEPFFLREARRRLYASAYRSDKTLATFFGRPPLMARRYSDRKEPLDLHDDIIANDDPEVVNDALSKLDNGGWNTDGKIFSISWIRLRSEMSVIREQFLEMSLAGEKDDVQVQRIQEIIAEYRQRWVSMPSQLRYDLRDEDEVWSSLEPEVALRMISAYLEHLHMDFQMQRLARRQTQMAVPDLLEISMKLLSTVLVFNKQRNQDYNIQRCFPTLILFYCLPSAGVLALELRRCTLENVPLPSTVSRADIIRNLSVLISCLEWAVLPGDGNHKLCSELNKMLALVLDEVLNYQPAPCDGAPDRSGAALGGVNTGFFDFPLIDGMQPIPTESEDFLTWLDGANWNNTYLF